MVHTCNLTTAPSTQSTHTRFISLAILESKLSLYIYTLTVTITLFQSIYMSWLRGKKASVTNLKAEELQLNRAATPTPRNPVINDEKVTFRSGLLTIRVFGAEGVALPPGTALPLAVQQALASQQGKIAASVSPSSVNQQRLVNKSRGNRCVDLLRHSTSSLILIFSENFRDSIQRTQCWWLPYLVMEYEVNQVLITPLGGELDKPLYMYQAHL
jgi:serum/glucocorticoid-regulated kinase 2